jgi:hypothetical protein
MDDEIRKQKRRLVVLTVSISVVVILVFVILQHYTKNKTGHDARYYDKYSGETVSTLHGQTAENYGIGNPAPLYLGFSTLIKQGFTEDDIATIQAAYEAYFADHKMKVTEVSLDVSSYKKTDVSESDDGISVSSYNVVFNRKDMYRTELEPIDLDTLKVLLYDMSGNLLTSYPSANQSNDDVNVDPG